MGKIIPKINCEKVFSIKYRRAFGFHIPFDRRVNLITDPHVSNWALGRSSHNKRITRGELVHILGSRIHSRLAKQRMNLSGFLKVEERMAVSVTEGLISSKNYAAIVTLLRDCFNTGILNVYNTLDKNPKVFEKINNRLYSYGRYNMRFTFILKQILSKEPENFLLNGELLDVYKAEIIIKNSRKSTQLYKIIKKALRNVDKVTKLNFLTAACSNEEIALAFEMFRIELGLLEAEIKANNHT